MDPNYISTLPGCPSGKLCRHSDSAYANFKNSSWARLGRLAEPVSYCNNPTTHCTLTVNTSTEIPVGVMSGAPLIGDEPAEGVADEQYDPKDEDTVRTIKELLDTRVRPAVANDGGDITFHGFRDGVVYLHMRGACSGCPSSTATLRHGIENLLKHFCPDVQEVRPV